MTLVFNTFPKYSLPGLHPIRPNTFQRPHDADGRALCRSVVGDCWR